MAIKTPMGSVHLLSISVSFSGSVNGPSNDKPELNIKIH